MFQKVDEVAGLGRLDVFAAADCVQIAAAVHELRDQWIVRSPGTARQPHEELDLAAAPAPTGDQRT